MAIETEMQDCKTYAMAILIIYQFFITANTIVAWALFCLHIVHIAYPVVATLILLGSIFVHFLMLFQRKSRTQGAEQVAEKETEDVSDDEDNDNGIVSTTHQPLIRFGHTELVSATTSFSSDKMIAERGYVGSSAIVYRGILASGEAVTVKRFDVRDPESKKRFLTELKILAHFRHTNLHNILGYSAQGMLVFPLNWKSTLAGILHSGDEDEHENDDISSCKRLSRVEIKKIAVGVASGLAYLHHDCGLGQAIVHGNLSPHCILLGYDLQPHVADFGSAFLSSNDEACSSAAQFTAGYAAPERAYEVTATPKVDVYSFGVLLLELLTGLPPTHPKLSEHGMSLSEWCQSALLLQCNSSAHESLDNLFSGFPEHREEAEKFVRLGISCTQNNPMKRPDMREVVRVLTFSSSNQKSQRD